MKLEEHEKAYDEHIKNIKRAIDEGLEENQRNAGFNISQGAVELVSIYLHKLRLFQDSGDMLDHRIFKNKGLTEKKLPFEFRDHKKILQIMREIELERNVLCYGKRKPKQKIEKMIKLFNNLREIINSNLSKENGNGKK